MVDTKMAQWEENINAGDGIILMIKFVSKVLINIIVKEQYD